MAATVSIRRLQHPTSNIQHPASYTDSVAEPERLILIDGHSLIYRSYFAFQGSRNQGAVEFTVRRTGEIVTAVYGFTSVFLSIIDDLKPEYAAIALDAPAKTFRHEKDAQYKATRVSMPDELRRQAI